MLSKPAPKPKTVSYILRNLLLDRRWHTHAEIMGLVKHLIRPEAAVRSYENNVKNHSDKSLAYKVLKGTVYAASEQIRASVNDRSRTGVYERTGYGKKACYRMKGAYCSNCREPGDSVLCKACRKLTGIKDVQEWHKG